MLGGFRAEDAVGGREAVEVRAWGSGVAGGGARDGGVRLGRGEGVGDGGCCVMRG